MIIQFLVTVSIVVPDSFFKYSTSANYVLGDPTVKEKNFHNFFQNTTLTCLYMSRLNYLLEHIIAKCFKVAPLAIP